MLSSTRRINISCGSAHKIIFSISASQDGWPKILAMVKRSPQRVTLIEVLHFSRLLANLSHSRLEVWNGFVMLCYAALSIAVYLYRIARMNSTQYTTVHTLYVWWSGIAEHDEPIPDFYSGCSRYAHRRRSTITFNLSAEWRKSNQPFPRYSFV